MRRLPLLAAAVALLGYAAAARLLLLPDVVLPAHRRLADLPEGSCATPAFSAEVQRQGEILFVPLGDIPPSLQLRILQQEDGYFYEHRGVEWGVLARSLGRDLAAGRIVYGGSTLSMQLARELFLDKRRTVGRKLREIAYALQLERRLGKQQILELYVNVVDWGPGLRGIGAASCFYYGRAPASLSDEEAARLVSLLPSPKRLGAGLRRPAAPTPAAAPEGP